MTLDIDLLAFRSFVVLAIMKSYTTAAQLLAISPSGLTKRIQSLERQLGTPLLVRDHGGVEGLTRAGTLAIRGAEPLLKAVEALTAGAPVATLRVAVQGFDPQIAARRAVRAAALGLHAVRPGVSLLFTQLGYNDPAVALRSGRANIAITAVPMRDDNLESVPLWPLERVGIVAATHPLAGRGTVEAEEFAAHRMVYSPNIAPDFMDLWTLRDVRPLAAAPLVELAPIRLADVLTGIETNRAGMAIHPEAARHLPPGLRKLTLLGVPRTWYYAVTRRSEADDLTSAFLRLVQAPAP